MKQLLIIYASTSGHTEYVCNHVAAVFGKKKRSIQVVLKRVEQANLADLTKADCVILASGTWNTGGIEGQLNPYMHAFTHTTIAEIDLQNKPMSVIGCGDTRYRYTCNAAHLLEEFIKTHNGHLLPHSLRIINEPYGQEEKMEHWVEKCLTDLQNIPS